jgi:hypothetical protein
MLFANLSSAGGTGLVHHVYLRISLLLYVLGGVLSWENEVAFQLRRKTKFSNKIIRTHRDTFLGVSICFKVNLC